MTRYFFNLADGRPFRDPDGEELRDDQAAWVEALRTMRDVESSLDLETSPRWSIEVKRDGRSIFRIDVSAQKCLPSRQDTQSPKAAPDRPETPN